MELLDQLEAENPENPALAPKVSTHGSSQHTCICWHTNLAAPQHSNPSAGQLPVLTEAHTTWLLAADCVCS